jgi:hypothetical protein
VSGAMFPIFTIAAANSLKKVLLFDLYWLTTLACDCVPPGLYSSWS